MKAKLRQVGVARSLASESAIVDALIHEARIDHVLRAFGLYRALGVVGPRRPQSQVRLPEPTFLKILWAASSLLVGQATSHVNPSKSHAL